MSETNGVFSSYFQHADSRYSQALALCPTVPMTVPARGSAMGQGLCHKDDACHLS
jgi:hypothetical protein